MRVSDRDDLVGLDGLVLGPRVEQLKSLLREVVDASEQLLRAKAALAAPVVGDEAERGERAQARYDAAIRRARKAFLAATL